MRIALFRLVVVSLILAAPLRAADANVLTLEQALGTVEGVNLNVLLSREAAVQALEAVTLQRASVLPTLSGSLQQRRSQGVSIGTVVVSSGRPTSRFDGLISSNFAVFNPAVFSALKGARLGAQVAQENFQAVVQTVLADVAETYFAHLRNLRRLDVLDANIARAQSLLSLARNQLNAGVATQIDVTRAEAQLAQAEQARLQQVTALVQSELFLKRLLNIEPIRPLRLENFQVRRVGTDMFALSEEKTAFEKRADLIAAQKSLEQTKLAVRTATFERYPTLSLNGNYGLASSKYDDDNKQEQWNASVNISMPFFDGFRTSGNRRIALSRQRSQEFRVRSLELQISSEVRLAVQDAGSRNAQIVVAEKTVRLSQEELRLAQQRYQQGVADNREVVEAQNRLAIAEDNMVEAVFQYNLSRVELARAKGNVRTVLGEKVP